VIALIGLVIAWFMGPGQRPTAENSAEHAADVATQPDYP
jgi:hypothetical protein